MWFTLKCLNKQIQSTCSINTIQHSFKMKVLALQIKLCTVVSPGTLVSSTTYNWLATIWLKCDEKRNSEWEHTLSWSILTKGVPSSAFW